MGASEWGKPPNVLRGKRGRERRRRRSKYLIKQMIFNFIVSQNCIPPVSLNCKQLYEK
jgi:hypothetical protein